MRFILPMLLLWGIPVFAAGTLAPPVFTANLVKGGSFETPSVQGRTPMEHGGDPSNNGRGPGWITFRFENSGTNGKVTGGVTNEIARTGAQSLYIDFDHVNGAYKAASLISNFIPVVSDTNYQIGIWGRIDPKDPIGPEGRSAYLKLEVDFFAKDANESVGDPIYAVQPLPGSKGHEAAFKSDSWNRFYVDLASPPGAVFAQITWRWETGSDPGERNGVMFFDDVTMTGPPNPIPNLTPAPVQEEPDVPDTTGTTGTTPQ